MYFRILITSIFFLFNAAGAHSQEAMSATTPTTRLAEEQKGTPGRLYESPEKTEGEQPETHPSEGKITESAGYTPSVVLLIGDSMVGGLAPRFNDYAAKNGFEFHSIVWNGSTTKDWAIAADLQYQIQEWQPGYIFICLGTNDLGYLDYAKREEAIQTILSKVGNIPYTWIGPLRVNKFPNRTMVDVIKSQTGEGRFFDSSDVIAERVDGIHPTRQAASAWVDDIVDWMRLSDSVANPIYMQKPDERTNYHPDEYHQAGYHGRR